jgi:hypothetical protein
MSVYVSIADNNGGCKSPEWSNPPLPLQPLPLHVKHTHVPTVTLAAVINHTAHTTVLVLPSSISRGQLKCDGTRAETRFLLSAKRTSPFKSAGASFQSTVGSRVVRISGSNAGYTMFRGSVKGTGYQLQPIAPSLPLPCVTVCHHISTGVYSYWTASWTAGECR